MAYMNQERKAKIKAMLDKNLKGTGVKFSLRCTSLSITCTIKSAPIDLIANSNETCSKDFYQVARGFKPNTTAYEQVNQYHYKNHFSGEALDIMNLIVKSMYAADYYDNSDAMTDYFDTAYYVNIQIGQWDKPFIVK
jgi:hypothetical protein